MYINEIRKALVPVIVAVVLGGLGYFGVTEGMTVGEAAVALATAVAVWVVPNKAKA